MASFRAFPEAPAELLRRESTNLHFGRKTIGFVAGCALLVNNVTGPGVPQLPNLFVEAGWLVPSTCILVVWVMTTISSAMYVEAMQRMPGNDRFQNHVEYTSIVRYYFGRHWYVASQVGLNGALQSLCIISIIQSTQIMDQAVSSLSGKTCAINLTPFQNVWRDASGAESPVAGSSSFLSCIDANNISQGNPWGCHAVLSAGFLLTACMAIPFGRWNLDESMVFQTVAVVLTACCWAVWTSASLSSNHSGEGLQVVNTDPQTGSVAGVIGAVLFNFGFVTTVPSWVNEKRPDVSVNRTLWSGTAACVLVFFAVGISGALAFADVLQGQVTGTCRRQVQDPTFNCYNDIMQAVLSAGAPWQGTAVGRFVARASVELFPIVSVISSIPVFAIVIKYNMMDNGFTYRVSFIWGVLLPWLIAFPLLYMPNVLGQFINLTSLVFVSFTDFVVPLALYVVLQRRDLPVRKHHLRVGTVVDPLAASASAEECPAALAGPSPLPLFPTIPSSFEVSPMTPTSSAVVHHTFPKKWGCSSHCKTLCAASIAVVLAAASLVGGALTVVQGNYEVDAQTCALVGS